jgi:hypothetical protein
VLAPVQNSRDFAGFDAIPHPQEATVVPAADTTAQTGSAGESNELK